MIVFVLLVVCAAVSGATLFNDWRTVRGDAAPDDPDDHSWHCVVKQRWCVRSASDCEISAARNNDLCKPQGQAACFSSRDILKDATEPKCFAAVSVCEVFRAAAQRDPERDNVTECDGYDAGRRDRRILMAKIVLGVVGAFAVLSVFAWSLRVSRQSEG